MELLNPGLMLPAEWKPYNQYDRVEVARNKAQDIQEEYGVPVLLSAVVGSTLYGLDNADSDIDVLVVTDDSVSKGHSVVGDVDVQMIPLKVWQKSLNGSFFLHAALESLFTVVSPEYSSYFRSTHVPEEHTVRAAQKTGVNSVNRAVSLDKQGRNLMYHWNRVHSGSFLCPRSLYPTGTGGFVEQSEWLEQTAKLYDKEDKVRELADHLRYTY